MNDSRAAAVAAGTVCAAGFMAWAVRGRASSVFGPSVYRGPATRRALALTFDDGPSEDTPRVLEILARHDASATFFQCGANVERLPEIARAVHLAGHEIGNHGHSHPMYCFKPPKFIESDLRRAQAAITLATGAVPVLCRVPFGVRWFGLREAQRRLGLLGVMWTVIGYDWSLTADSIVKRVAAGASNGAILCLHDGRELSVRPDIGATVAAVRELVPRLVDQGYQIETVSQLICPKK